MSRWRIERLRRPRELLLATDRVWDLAEGSAYTDFAAWCAAHRGARCNLNVSSALVTELPVDPALPLDDDADLLAWARLQLGSLGAGSADDPPDCAAWQAAGVRGVSVLEGMRVATLAGQARGAGVRIVTMRPWWSAVLARALRRHPRLRKGQAQLVVAEGARIGSIAFSAGAVTAVQTSYLDAADAAALADWARVRPADLTLAVGFGIAVGELGGVEALPGLHADGPAIAWQDAL